MKEKMKYDFSGYATKNDLKCSDGRTIQKDAFKHHDGQTVPLVWQHLHNTPNNILGHAILENREDGVYTYGKFNETEGGKNARELVVHGDITNLSIYANELKQKGQIVQHGFIREVSLVLSGANPGALIDNLSFSHSDGTYEQDETEAIIYTGLNFSSDGKQKDSESKPEIKHEETGKTVEDVFKTLNEEQMSVVYAMIAHAFVAGQGGEGEDEEDIEHSNTQGGKTIMKKNIFDTTKEEKKDTKKTLTHDQFQTIIADAKKRGSLKEAFLAHAATYGIENIEILFPDAKPLRTTPDFIKRDTTWVGGVLNETHHTPFSRIKSRFADITANDARAKGYITATMKTEEVFPVMKRETTPTTIYKKQKLDKDDITDITDFDVVNWLKGEMRGMLDEELARAVLIGDGRAVDDPERINPLNIRPIWTDDAFYSYKVELLANVSTADMIDEIIKARKHYKGTGVPSFYTTTDVLTDMLLLKDTTGRRLYNTVSELESVLRVSKIVEVEVMEGVTRTVGPNTVSLIGLMVNLRDYTIGADRGGQVSMFDDFDIDYNQYKYLIETRCSGCLTRHKAAVVIEKRV